MRQLNSVQIYFMYVKFETFLRLYFIENEELKASKLELIFLICKNKISSYYSYSKPPFCLQDLL